MSNYILTYTKTKFYPLEPIMQDIKIEDIAHSLSLMTRANGHFKQFYSVAQHSINCYKEAKVQGCSQRVQLACLLHDASESYISDLTRPVKSQLKEYFPIEERLLSLIYQKYGIADLTEEENQQIKDVDDALLYFEFMELMGFPVFDTAPVKHMEHDFSQREFTNVESEFIYIFNRLTQEKTNITQEGFLDRVDVMEEFYDKTEDFISYISSHPVLKNHLVDCVDALCLAVSGLLGLSNGFSTIPSNPTKDARGLNMEIIYGNKIMELE